MKKIIVLNGIHTSGKSTVGKYLGNNGFVYLPEIAMELLDKGIVIGATGDSQIQMEIMKRENNRDKIILSSDYEYIIESRHTAGLAHAKLHGGGIEKAVESMFRSKLELFDPCIVYLNLNTELIKARGSRLYDTSCNSFKEVIDFYRRLDECYKEIFLNYKIKTVFLDANMSKEAVFNSALIIVQEYLGG